MKTGIGVKGEFILKVSRKGGDIVRTIGPFDNLIVNNGLNQMVNPEGSYLQVCYLSNRETEVPVTQIQPVSLIQGTRTYLSHGNFRQTEEEPYYIRGRASWRFQTEWASGVPITSVGVGWYTGDWFIFNPFTHESVDAQIFTFAENLIKDEFGEPAPLTLEPDDILDVEYRLFLYPNPEPVETTLALGENFHTFRIVPSSLESDRRWRIANRDLETNFGYPAILFYGVRLGTTRRDSGGLVDEYMWEGDPELPADIVTDQLSSFSYDDYSPSDEILFSENIEQYSITFEFRWGIDDANFTTGIIGGILQTGRYTQPGGIRTGSLTTGMYTFWVYTVDPPIMKENTDILDLRFNITVSRYEEEE